MNFFDLITREELDDAPDDPQLAFTQLVGCAERRLADYTNKFDDDRDSWQAIEEARHGFMNVVIGLAKAYKVEPFASLEVPRCDTFDINVHRQFKADLDHYMTQLLVNNSIKGKRDSVQIAPKVKDKIRSYVHGLKTAIDEANITESKRASLHKKLSEFEAELDKQRLSLLAVTKLVIVILAVPGSLWGSYEVVTKLTNNVLQAIGEAKTVEDENRLLPDTKPPARLLPPRKDDNALKPRTEKGAKGSPADLDDEIPF